MMRAYALRLLLPLLLCAAALLLPEHAFAQSGGEEFSCNSDGSANGDLFNAAADCKGLMSGLVCSFENTLSQMFGKLYCGMQSSLIGPLGTLLTIYVIVVGIGILTGMIPATAPEAFKHLLKLVLVWAFASNSGVAIGVAYKFFMSFAQEGITIVLSVLKPPEVAGEWSANAAIKHIDEIVKHDLGAMLSSGDGHGGSDNPLKSCSNAIIKMVMLFAVVAPPIFLLAVYTAMQTIMVFVRAVVGYLLALTGMTFLMTVSPIFIGLALFKSTYHFFDKWLNYMSTFALQMVIVFAFLGIFEMISISSFGEGLLDIIVPYKTTFWLGPIRIPIDACTLCRAEMYYNEALHMDVPRCLITSHVDAATGATVTGPEAIPLWDLLHEKGIIYTLVTKIVALIMLSYALEGFIKQVPDIAAHLSGPKYAVRLSGKSLSPDGIEFALPGAETIKSTWEGAISGYNATKSDFVPVKAFGALGAAWGAGRNAALNEVGEEVSSFGRSVPRTGVAEGPQVKEKLENDTQVKDVKSTGNDSYEVEKEVLAEGGGRKKIVKTVKDHGTGHQEEFITSEQHIDDPHQKTVNVDLGNGIYYSVPESKLDAQTLGKLKQGQELSEKDQQTLYDVLNKKS